MNFLQTSSINQGNIHVVSNQVGSSTTHLLLHNEGNSQTFAYKCCSSNSWIINSGASDHICSSFSWFQIYKTIPPISVRLPNGQIALAKHVGSIMFSSNFVINNVLYIADISINLISVSQSCKQSKYKVNFTHDNCFIQDPTTRQMIGLDDNFE